MKLKTFLVALVALATFSFTISKVADYTVDTEASTIKWKGYKVTGSHFGNVNIKDGSLKFDDNKLVGGSFTIDMTSITVKDLKGDYAKKLEGHLKSKDFFGTDKFPTAKLKITKVVPYGTSGKYKITADLTIKSTTKSIKFMANVTDNEGTATADAKITVDRSDFDIRYGSGSFFDNLGDKTIYDEFELEISLTAKK